MNLEPACWVLAWVCCARLPSAAAPKSSTPSLPQSLPLCDMHGPRPFWLGKAESSELATQTAETENTCRAKGVHAQPFY